MKPMGRPSPILFFISLLTLVFISCGGDTGFERTGKLEVPDEGLVVQWYAIGGGLDEAEVRAAAEAELSGLPKDWRVELILFRDKSMAESFAKDETQKEEISLGFFDPSIALATSGGGLLLRNPGSDVVWTWFPAPGGKQ